ncbi:MAG: dUTP diphosphatase [Spirochaetaceae bacterium]|nr:dUTP diphosphatase [Spirochaetaceae bacterium]
MDSKTISIVVAEGAIMPEYRSNGASGLDVHAFLEQPLVIKPGDWASVPTGIRMELPEGYEAQVRPRSGLALEHGITCLNSPGTIDSDYRGEIRVLLLNLGKDAFCLKNGDRIAQLVISQYTKVSLEKKLDISGTERGAGGFGSTGLQ